MQAAKPTVTFFDACGLQQHLSFALSRFATCHIYLLLNVYFAKRILKNYCDERIKTEQGKMHEIWYEVLR